MEIFVRPASPQDIDVLRTIEFEARAALTEFRGGERLDRSIPMIVTLEFGSTIEDKTMHVLVAGIGSSVMGYLVARVAGRIATIEQVFVTRDTRTLGVGDALVSAAIDWSRLNGFEALDALALPGDRETKNLYERSGLTARLIVVTKTLT